MTNQKQIFVANLADLQKYYRDNVFLILGGELVIASNAVAPIEGYSLWATKKTSTGILATSSNTSITSYYIKKEAMPILGKATAKISFASEAVVKHSKKIKADDAIVLSAIPNGFKTDLVGYTFKKGILEAVSDTILDGATDRTFGPDLHVLVERFRIATPNIEIYWAGPVALPKSITGVTVLQNIWNAAPVQGIGGKVGSVFVEKYLTPLVIVIASLGGYFGAIYGPYTQYSKYADILEKENAQLKDSYRFSSDRLDHLQNIQSWLDLKKTAIDPSDKLNNLVNVIGKSTGVSVVSTKIIWNDKGGNSKDNYGFKPGNNFEIVVNVPIDYKKPIISQIAPYIKEWSLGSGISLAVSNSLAQTGEKDKNSTQRVAIQGRF